ncbi:MAG: [FeFe] hydrogenase H-cluster radical SAM maturase HydE [Ruminococcus sp.]|nr:[FeFe] hydrogenase H-cluster radical SAM maturase HydE [Ruminococcus sp.]
MESNRELIERLNVEHKLTQDEYAKLIDTFDEDDFKLISSLADKTRRDIFSNEVYLRGLIEFSSFCKNDCLYCGLRRSNTKAERYRLEKDEILACCEEGYKLGYRTFVLQSGEDMFFTDDRICDIVSGIKADFPDCAVTLSIGEKSRESYKAYFDAGADRYLLRHETADATHYARLHPPELLLENRKRCLYDLKDIGYQVGTGFMVGSPFQTAECLAEDMIFLRDLEPQMVGIGPFIPHSDTPFAGFSQGTTQLTVFMIALIRLTLPSALIPATTALATVDPIGREKGLVAGANVCMPNLSPMSVRKKYLLYDDKACTGDESAQCRVCLERRLNSVGFKSVVSRGDAPKFVNTKSR